MKTFITSVVLLVGVPAAVWAGVVVSPEIDAASGAAAISVLAGAVLILRSRQRRRG